MIDGLRLQAAAAGDRAALDDLLQAVQPRVEAVVRSLFRRFPTRPGFEDEENLVQASLLNLACWFQRKPPASPEEFVQLARWTTWQKVLFLLGHHGGMGLVRKADITETDLGVRLDWFESNGR